MTDITTAFETVVTVLNPDLHNGTHTHAGPQCVGCRALAALATIKSELARMKMLYEWEPPAEDVRDVIARLTSERDEAVAALRGINATHKARGLCLWAQDIADAVLAGETVTPPMMPAPYRDAARLSTPKEPGDDFTDACPPEVVCVCRDGANNDRLRDVLEALDGEVVARPETPAQVWAETMTRVSGLILNAQMALDAEHEARATARENKWYVERRDEEVSRLRTERDEAVAALREIAEWCDGSNGHDERWPDCPSRLADATLTRLSTPKEDGE